MSKTKITNEDASPESKKHGCCGGSLAEDQKAQPARKKEASPTGNAPHEHAHQSDGGSGCCGGGKASK